MADPLLSELRSVRLLCSKQPLHTSVVEYLVHKDEVDRFVAATVRLRGPGCVNPHSMSPTIPVDEISVAELAPSGPFWWTTPDLQNNDDPAGARLFQAGTHKPVWRSPEYEDRLRREEKSLLDAEANPK